MGLDMYIYKANKIKETLENRPYTRNEIEDLFSPLVISKDEYDMPMYRELQPYLIPVVVINQYIDMAKVKAYFNIPDEAKCGGCGCDAIGQHWYFHTEDNHWETPTISEEEIEKLFVYKQAKESYICQVEEVYYWRKAYDVQDFIHDSLGVEIENCGYYAIPLEVIADINERFEDTIPADKDLFYHEWY